MLLDVSDKKAYSLPFHCLLDKYAVAVPNERVSFALFKSLKTGPMENFFLKCTAMSKKAQRLLPSCPHKYIVLRPESNNIKSMFQTFPRCDMVAILQSL